MLGNRHSLVLWLTSWKEVLTKSDIDVLPQFKALWDQEREYLEKIGAEIYIPLFVSNDLVGILAVGPKRSEEPYSYDDQLNLTTLANQTAVAIEKARLYNVAQQELSERERAEKQLQLQLQRMNALRAIDVSITSTFTLDATLHVLLEQVITQLRVDAAAVLVLLIRTIKPSTIGLVLDFGLLRSNTQNSNLAMDLLASPRRIKLLYISPIFMKWKHLWKLPLCSN